MTSEEKTGRRKRSAFRRCRDIRYRVIDGQAVIIAQTAGEALVLNEIGTRVLELIDAGKTVEQIVTDLESRFDAHADRIRSDVESYIDDLEDAGIVEETPPSDVPSEP